MTIYPEERVEKLKKLYQRPQETPFLIQLIKANPILISGEYGLLMEQRQEHKNYPLLLRVI